MLAFVQFRENSKKLKTSLGHLGVKTTKFIASLVDLILGVDLTPKFP